MGAGQRAAGRQAHRSSTCGEGESVTWRVTPHCQRTRRWQREQVVVDKRYLVVEPSIPDLVVATVLGRIRDRRPEGVGIEQDLENRAYVPSASEQRNLSVRLTVCRLVCSDDVSSPMWFLRKRLPSKLPVISALPLPRKSKAYFPMNNFIERERENLNYRATISNRTNRVVSLKVSNLYTPLT